MIEKRLNHLREELRNLTKREVAYKTSNLLTEQQQTNENDEHYMQYKKRLNQLLRLHDKQVLKKLKYFGTNTKGRQTRQADKQVVLKRMKIF